MGTIHLTSSSYFRGLLTHQWDLCGKTFVIFGVLKNHFVMEKLVLLICVLELLVMTAKSNTNDYEDYQYDEPHDISEEESVEKEVATNEKLVMLTKPLEINVIAGDKVELPCMVDKLPSGVGTIWERPDVKQIVSIGDNLIQNNAEEYSIDAADAGNTLIISAATKKHEGQYKCKIATQENVEVTHTIRVIHPAPYHQALGERNSSKAHSISF